MTVPCITEFALLDGEGRGLWDIACNLVAEQIYNAIKSHTSKELIPLVKLPSACASATIRGKGEPPKGLDGWGRWRRLMGMKQILVMMAAVMSLSVTADEVVITDPILEETRQAA